MSLESTSFDWTFDGPAVNTWIAAQGGGQAWPTSYCAFGVHRNGSIVAGLAFYDSNGTNAFVNIAVRDSAVLRRLLRQHHLMFRRGDKRSRNGAGLSPRSPLAPFPCAFRRFV